MGTIQPNNQTKMQLRSGKVYGCEHGCEASKQLKKHEKPKKSKAPTAEYRNTIELLNKALNGSTYNPNDLAYPVTSDGIFDPIAFSYEMERRFGHFNGTKIIVDTIKKYLHLITPTLEQSILRSIIIYSIINTKLYLIQKHPKFCKQTYTKAVEFKNEIERNDEHFAKLKRTKNGRQMVDYLQQLIEHRISLGEQGEHLNVENR
jgi:hypothetical protein